MTKQILVLAKAYPPVVGGVETYSQAVVQAYLRLGWIPTVITQTEGARGWSRRLYPEGEVALYNVGPGRQSIVLFRLLQILRSVMAKKTFDMVHATTWRPALALWPWMRSQRLVLTVHGREVMNYPFYLKHAMIRLLARADGLATVSMATMVEAKAALNGQQAKGKWASVFNGITYPDAAEAFHRFPRGPMHSVRLLSLARHVPRKNIQGCIAALAQLHQEGLDFEYHIGGRGPMMASLQAQVIEAGLAEKVKFLGYVADEAVPSLFMEADAFLHPQTNVGEGNDFEGFGLVIADAMSFGCTVLAGDAGGPRDFVRHEVNGLLVDGLNGPELIAEIRRLIIDHELRNRLGQEGRRFALHELDWTKHVRSLIGLAGDSDGGMS